MHVRRGTSRELREIETVKSSVCNRKGFLIDLGLSRHLTVGKKSSKMWRVQRLICCFQLC